ncbi:MAG: CCA tRNA nucleotidyltransferase, partial [Candidatus Bathyarchaeia archaeon]
PVERYAEHPYVEGWVEGTRVNIVPCYEVKEGEWLTAVDRTLLHTGYVRRKLSDEARREVRLLKRFMKGIGVYGADIKTGGFSGYLCELLVIRYGLFLRVLRAASRWRPRTALLIDPVEGMGLKEAKAVFPEPLIVVDPVDPRRNVASAVSLQKMSEFAAASKAFLKRPAIAFFYPPEPMVLSSTQLKEHLKARGTDLIVLAFGKVEAVPDVLWGQMYRSLRALVTLLREHDFKVLRAAAWSDEKGSNTFTFELEQSRLPIGKVQTGPPVTANEAENFIRKHLASPRTISGPCVQDDRWIVLTTRKETDAASLLKAKLSREAAQIGIRDRISEALRSAHRLYIGSEIAEFCRGNPAYAAFLAGFLKGTPPWLEKQP